MTLINTIKVSDLNDGQMSCSYFINLKGNTNGKYAKKIRVGENIILFQFLNDLAHDSIDEPAFTEYKNGKLMEVARYKFGQLQDKDDNNPALLSYWFNGKIKTFSMFTKNKANNSKSGGPARIQYYENGNVQAVSYLEENMLEDFGSIPAYTVYDRCGNIMFQEHYKKGVKIT